LSVEIKEYDNDNKIPAFWGLE